MESTQIGNWVLYKNNQLIAFNKPATLPVQNQGEQKSLLTLAEIYTKQKLHIIHRLDQPASGVILFAKNPKALATLNEQFKARQVEKVYLVAVKNRPTQESATLTHYLKKLHKSNKSIALTEPSSDTKKAVLKYTYLGATDHYHCLQINLITGRHHQIRAQLAAIGSPVKGDVKYGARRNNPDRSIHLHAWKIRFKHPVNHQMETIEAPLPSDPVWDNFKGIIENEI